jgi:hypothetical protein
MSARSIPEPRLPNVKRQFSLSVDDGPFLTKYTYENVELSDGTGYCEQGEELLRDERGWLRIDDERRPRRRQPSPPR